MTKYMKMMIMKAGLILMALTTMITMAACSQINNATVNDVCKALAEKYGENFVAAYIGDRLNTGYAKLLLHPENDDSLLFTAKMDRKSKSVEDDYVIQKVNAKVDQVVNQCMEDVGIKAYSISMVITPNTLVVEPGDYSPEEFQRQYTFERYTVYLLVNKADCDGEKLFAALAESHAALNVKLRYRVFVLEEENYQKCVSAVKNEPDANPTTIEKHMPVAEVWLDVDHGEISITKDEFLASIGGA